MDLNNLLTLLREIDNPSQDEKHSLESNLKSLVENIFKLQYWELERGRDYKHWGAMVSSSRNYIYSLLQNNPSLRKYLEQVYPEIYQDAVSIWKNKFYIPSDAPIMLERILRQDYFG